MESTKTSAKHDLFDLAGRAEDIEAQLDIVLDVLECFRLALVADTEIRPENKRTEELQAMCLLDRLPCCVAAFDLATEKMKRIRKQADEISDSLYALHRETKGEHAS